MVHILVVESDSSAADFLMRHLMRNGHDPWKVGTGKEALMAYQDAELVLLDLELPDLDGLEVCRLIRASSDTPIITSTAGGSELDKVLSLQAGSDDCLVKPYGVRELCARIEAVMRRARKAVVVDTTKVMSDGSLSIDPRSREVRLLDQVIRTTRKEFDLLLLLASEPGTVFSRKELMARVWKDEWSSSRTIDTHVSMLRNKLGRGNCIATVRGIGYRFDHNYISARRP
jgi:DNA-binding response OmpR family regulator